MSTRERNTGLGSLPPLETGASSPSLASTSLRVFSISLFSWVVSTMMSTLTSIKRATTTKMGVKLWSAAYWLEPSAFFSDRSRIIIMRVEKIPPI